MEMVCGNDEGGSHHTNTLELIVETATAAAIDADAMMDALGPEDERVKRVFGAHRRRGGSFCDEARNGCTHGGGGTGRIPSACIVMIVAWL